MINFLHNNSPEAIFFQLGSLTIHKYGITMTLGIIAVMICAIFIGKFYKIHQDTIIDATFYTSIAGIIGARLFAVLLESPYYIEHPQNIIKIWNGGLAIHGALIGGVISVYFFAKKRNINLWKLLSITAPGIALGQAIARWGNYFNQELYGLPTGLPWGIPIENANKVFNYETFTHFHPTFLYESLGSLIIFTILSLLHYLKLKKKININHEIIVFTYGVLYSILRFSLEFVRIDYTPELFNLRLPQITSILIVLIIIIMLISPKISKKGKSNNTIA